MAIEEGRRLVALDVLANDHDPDGDEISIVGVVAPPGVAVLNAGGRWLQVESTTAGTYDLRYTIWDRKDMDTAAIELTLSP
jgi:hypothetical protein